MGENLIEAIQSECDRCRKILPYYEEIPTGAIGAYFIRMAIKKGESAIANMDTVAMVTALQELRDCKE